MFTMFGGQFFVIGVLKFVADCAGFASPMLLNLIIAFMEDSHGREVAALVSYRELD